MRSLILLLLFILPLILLETGSASGNDLPVLGGSPQYVFGRTGAIVSDHGSHYGWSCEASGGHLAWIARHDCRAGARRDSVEGFERFYVLADGEARFSPALSREILFDPSGWAETASDGDLEARARAITLAPDTLLVALTVENASASPIEIVPALHVYGHVSGEVWVSGGPDQNPVIVATRNRAPSLDTIYTAYASSFDMASLESRVEDGCYEATLLGEAAQIPAGGSLDLHYVSALSHCDGGATDLALQGADRVGHDPWGAVDEVLDDWDAFLGSFPSPHTDDPALHNLYRMSAAVLRMIRYRPAGRMDHECAFPAKGHYNFFWLWDTCFHVLGQAEWDTALAHENLRLIYQSRIQVPGVPNRGMIHNKIDDELRVEIPFFRYSQNPLFGWTVRLLAERAPHSDDTADLIAESYEAGAPFIDWWSRERDRNRNGLCEYLCGWEGGMDNSPRWDGLLVRFPVPTGIVDAVDLNAWLFIYLREVGRWAGRLGLGAQEVGRWESRAEELSALIDSLMWHEADGCWYDLAQERDGASRHVRLRTPAIWMPAFAGATRDLDRIRRVIEEHVLDESSFWGEIPIPSVAYDEADYDPSEYWRGPTWVNMVYITAEMLFRYGYEEEARELARRILGVMAEKKNIREYYDSATGEGLRTYQFGWSAALAVELLLERYEREGYLLERASPECAKRSGFIKRLRLFPRDEIFYEVDAGSYEVPHSRLASLDGEPLAASGRIELVLSSPFADLKEAEVRFPSLEEYEAFQVTPEGPIPAPGCVDPGEGLCFTADVSEDGSSSTYEIVRTLEGDGEGRCGCGTFRPHNKGPVPVGQVWMSLFLYLLSALWIGYKKLALISPAASPARHARSRRARGEASRGART